MPKLEQVRRLASVLLQPGGLEAYARWRPFSITSFRMLKTLKQQGLEFGTVLDGGANAGQFARAVKELYPGARVISFEPLPAAAAKLRRNLSDRPEVRIVEAALGSREGTLEFYPNRYSLASSALPVHANQRDSFPGVAQLAAIRVPVVTLDSILWDEPLTPPVLLKLDLQGYEIEALKGGWKTLTRVAHVLVETAFKPMYQGEPLYEELHEFMHAAGFRFQRPIDFLADGRGEIVQMDALFSRGGDVTAATGSKVESAHA